MSKHTPISAFLENHSVCELSEGLQLAKLNTNDPDLRAASALWDELLGVCSFGNFTGLEKTAYVESIGRIAMAWTMLKDSAYKIFPERPFWEQLVRKFEEVRNSSTSLICNGGLNTSAATAVADALDGYTTAALQEIGVMSAPKAVMPTPGDGDELIIGCPASYGTGIDLEPAKAPEEPEEQAPHCKVGTLDLGNAYHSGFAHRSRATSSGNHDCAPVKPPIERGLDLLLAITPEDANVFVCSTLKFIGDAPSRLHWSDELQNSLVFGIVQRMFGSSPLAKEDLQYTYNPWMDPHTDHADSVADAMTSAIQNVGSDELPMFVRKGGRYRGAEWSLGEITQCLVIQITCAIERLSDGRRKDCSVRPVIYMLGSIRNKVVCGRDHSVAQVKTFFLIERLLELFNISLAKDLPDEISKLLIQAIEVTYQCGVDDMAKALFGTSYGWHPSQYMGRKGQARRGYPQQPPLGISSSGSGIDETIDAIYRSTGQLPVGLIYSPGTAVGAVIVSTRDRNEIEHFMQAFGQFRRH